jgi:26S proteasome regulatory subunit N8
MTATTTLSGGGAAAAASSSSSSSDGSTIGGGITITDVTIHPLVLLSAADHYHRVARGTRKRVVGVLLGQINKGGRVDATNSFAVPFEEDSRNPVRTYVVVVVVVLF